MMSKLDDLLNRIDPQRTIEESNSRLDRALNSFAYTRSTVSTIDQFKKILGDFYWHVEGIMLALRDGFDPSDDWKQGFAMQVLDQIYGGRGWLTGFRIAQSGVEGGLYGVLKKVGEASAQKHTERHIDSEVGRFIDEITKDYSVFEATVDEYVRKFGRILPPEVLSRGAMQLKLSVNFYKVLKNHPYLVKRMREVGRI